MLAEERGVVGHHVAREPERRRRGLRVEELRSPDGRRFAQPGDSFVPIGARARIEHTQLRELVPLAATPVAGLEALSQRRARGVGPVSELERALRTRLVAELGAQAREREGHRLGVRALVDGEASLGHVGALGGVILAVEEAEQRVEELAARGRPIEARVVRIPGLGAIAPLEQAPEAQRQRRDRRRIAAVFRRLDLSREERCELVALPSSLEHLGEHQRRFELTRVVVDDLAEQRHRMRVVEAQAVDHRPDPLETQASALAHVFDVVDDGAEQLAELP